ncbi:hypothetical protein HBH70_089850 [Parastagonospora nodorum]|nr:hypothetical protein HBH53_062910 [Parastagonospora nodorum]KAH3975247.1 hypothetical protein HBH52_123950 [Parastagonospora nodorum]KAH3999358.1 hypothetical protein HBI10_117550 [Parastagonospora nodorum]KAH4025273.1 hypothetical protein HBI13_079640 [Parastagonospora nodorum]KAH4049101.1 hypothetical protein HBH49_142340 [Parastagonospora nodorum]
MIMTRISIPIFSLWLASLSMATPVDVYLRDIITLPPASTSNMACQRCLNSTGNPNYLYANGKCNTLDNGDKYYACSSRWRCGICMMFKGEQCMGDMVRLDDSSAGSGGWHWGDLKEAQSYYCF